MVTDNSPPPEGTEPGPGKPPVALIAAGAAVALIIGIILVVVVFSGGGDGDKQTAVGTATETFHAGLSTGQPTIEATLDLDRATGEGQNLTELGANARLAIPRFGVDGELVLFKVGPDGVMPDPATPDQIAYYDFSDFDGLGGAPGLGGNGVFAAHVDSGSKYCDNGRTPPPCLAIFSQVRNLKLGDIVEVKLDDVVYQYSVTANDSVSARTADWQKIVSSTAEETITLITCGGSFDPSSREYDSRQVVTAVRIP